MQRFRPVLAQIIEVSGLVALVVGAFLVTSSVGFLTAGAVSLWFAKGMST